MKPHSKSKFSLTLSVLALLSYQLVDAADVTMIGSNTFGQSWLTTSDWSDGLVPAGGNDYTVGSAFTVRTPQANNPADFAGDSLTIEGNFFLKHSGSVTIDNLILSGATVSNQGFGSSNVNMTLGGNISLVSATTSTIEGGSNVDRDITLASLISGDGNLDIVSLSDSGSSVFLTNASNSFTGLVTVQDTGVLDFDYDHNTTASLSIASGGLLNLDQVLTFSSLDLLGNAIGAGTYDVSDFTALDSNYTALFVDGGGSITVIPEPSAFAMFSGIVGVGLCLVKRRCS